MTVAAIVVVEVEVVVDVDAAAVLEGDTKEPLSMVEIKASSNGACNQ